jgi:hypothetical protein
LSEKKCYLKILDEEKNCEKKDCRYFLDSAVDLNCSLHTACRGPMTLEEIGTYYNISRMRICQIEKSILSKLKKSSSRIVK